MVNLVRAKPMDIPKDVLTLEELRDYIKEELQEQQQAILLEEMQCDNLVDLSEALIVPIQQQDYLH